MNTRRVRLVGSLLVGGWLVFATTSWADTIGFITANRSSVPAVEYLTAYGHVIKPIVVDSPHRTGGDLSLSDLAGIDTLLIGSNVPFRRPAAIGDVAAAFADSGRGVVLAEFVFQTDWALSGRIMTSAYSPFTTVQTGQFGESARIGTVVDPQSPLFAGVNIANLWTLWESNVDLVPGATLIATWDSTRPAFAFTAHGRSNVVALNLDPRDDHLNSDMQRLVSNALFFASPNAAQTPEPSTIALVGVGVAGLWRRARATRRAQRH